MGVFAQALRQSCEGSSMKALPRLVRAKSWVQMCLWFLALLIGLLAMGYQLAGLFIGYFQYSTSVNIAEVQGTPPFPDVTLCHIDPHWTFSKLETALDGEESFASYVHRVRTITESHSDTDASVYLRSLASVHGYLQNIFAIHGEAERLKNLLVIDCVVNTEWEPAPCFRDGDTNLVNTSVFIDPMFGMCVTFKVHREGTKGLDLLVYLDDQEQEEMKTFSMLETAMHTTTSAGRLVIHPRDSFPDIWLASHTVQAGKKVSLSIEATERSVLAEPYGSCITPEDADKAKDIPGFAINRHGYECYRMCAKDYILQDCQCLDIYYAATKSDRDKTQMCGKLESNITQTIERMKCADDVINSMNEPATMYDKCVCPTPCDQFVYEYSAEEMNWPHHTYHLSFYEQYIRRSPFAHKFRAYEDLLHLSKSNKTEAQHKLSQLNIIQRNFAEIRVLNHQRTYFHFTESPLISPEALFGNLGGILNLWAGITFITIIEVFEFVHQLTLSRRDEAHNKTHSKNHQPLTKNNGANHV